MLWLEPVLSKKPSFEDSHEGDQWHLLLSSSEDYLSSPQAFLSYFQSELFSWMSFSLQKVMVLSLTELGQCLPSDFLHVKTQFWPKTSSTKPNRQVAFPFQSTFLAQGQVTLASSLCIFSTFASSSLLEPDLLLTIHKQTFFLLFDTHIFSKAKCCQKLFALPKFFICGELFCQ